MASVVNAPVLFERTKTVVLKTNNTCNLKCTYCYDDDNKRDCPSKLDANVISCIFDELISFSKHHGINHINVIWHGGEPLLMGLNYFDQVVEIQNKSGFDFSNLIQTNGVSVNREWITFFRRNHFKIGVSFDGSILANNIHRQSSHTVVENIKLLNDHSIFPSIISVISDNNHRYYKEMFDFFSQVKTEYVDLIPCYENNGKYSLSNRHYEDFMIPLFDMWWQSDKKINFRLFNNIIDVMNGTTTSHNFITCSLTGQCGEIISINSDQRLYFCDCLPKEESNCIGHLTEGLDNISGGKKYIALRTLNAVTESECNACEFLKICGKGCLNRRIKNVIMKDYYCEARQSLFKHIMQTLQISNIHGDSKNAIPAFTRGPQPFDRQSN